MGGGEWGSNNIHWGNDSIHEDKFVCVEKHPA